MRTKFVITLYHFNFEQVIEINSSSKTSQLTVMRRYAYNIDPQDCVSSDLIYQARLPRCVKNRRFVKTSNVTTEGETVILVL